jgi:hypothetical protein
MEGVSDERDETRVSARGKTLRDRVDLPFEARRAAAVGPMRGSPASGSDAITRCGFPTSTHLTMRAAESWRYGPGRHSAA